MNFEYEISAEEYASGQAAYCLLTRGRRRFIQFGLFWIVVGVFFIDVACNQKGLDWAPVLLIAVGCYCIYCGLANLFLEFYFRLRYRKSGMAGKRFRAEISESGLEVAGEDCTWRVPWAGVLVKGEDKRVFTIYAAGIIFMFGKKYLSPENQNELRRLAGLPRNL